PYTTLFRSGLTFVVSSGGVRPPRKRSVSLQLNETRKCAQHAPQARQGFVMRVREARSDDFGSEILRSAGRLGNTPSALRSGRSLARRPLVIYFSVKGNGSPRDDGALPRRRAARLREASRAYRRPRRRARARSLPFPRGLARRQPPAQRRSSLRERRPDPGDLPGDGRAASRVLLAVHSAQLVPPRGPAPPRRAGARRGRAAALGKPDLRHG